MSCENNCIIVAPKLLGDIPAVVPPAPTAFHKDDVGVSDTDLAAGNENVVQTLPEAAEGVDEDALDADESDDDIEAIDAQIESDITEIYLGITDGSAFANPMQQELSGAQNSITDFTTTWTPATLYAQAVAQWDGTGSAPTLGLFNDFFSLMGEVQSALAQFLMHSNILSGITFGGEMNLASIIRTVIASRRLVGFEGCSLLGGVFAAINKAGDYNSKFKSVGQKLQSLLSNINGEIQGLISWLNGLVSEMLNDIANSALKFLEAQTGLLIRSLADGLADLFDDECFGDVFNAIGQEKTKQLTNNIRVNKNAKIAEINRRIPKL